MFRISGFCIFQAQQPGVPSPHGKKRVESKDGKEETLRTSRAGPSCHLPHEKEPLREGCNEKKTERRSNCGSHEKRRMMVTLRSDKQKRGNGKPSSKPE